MTLARITGFGPRLHVPISPTPPTWPTSARCPRCCAICSRFGDQLNRISYKAIEKGEFQAQLKNVSADEKSTVRRSWAVNLSGPYCTAAVQTVKKYRFLKPARLDQHLPNHFCQVLIQIIEIPHFEDSLKDLRLNQNLLNRNLELP